MYIPNNLIVNADDLGLNLSVNKAILFCYTHGYINSTSLLTNTIYWDDTIDLIYNNPFIKNIGVHINFAEDKPITNFSHQAYLDECGNWDLRNTRKILNYFDAATKLSFLKEIYAQIDKALSSKISITHLDSHYHLHTQPCFYKLFLQAAKHYKLKLRL